MDEAVLRQFFERYATCFNHSLAGTVDATELAALYAPEFVAASPMGLMSGKNDSHFKKRMAQGYARYRALGTKGMQVRGVRLSPIDEQHCVAHVAWTATYARENEPEVAIEFEVHYFVRSLGGKPKVFGWVSGDEQELLRKHGIA